MCGRFTLTLDPAQLREAFPGLLIPDDLRSRYNIAPSQPVAVIPNTGENKLEFFNSGIGTTFLVKRPIDWQPANQRSCGNRSRKTSLWVLFSSPPLLDLV